MAASLESILGLPNWPLLLSDEQAAAYLGVSRETFRKAVDTGDFPRPGTAHPVVPPWPGPCSSRACR
jgi:hypothetical protein